MSQRFQSVSVDDIRKVNNMGTNDRLTVGKTLRIPK
ncbi:MAG: LysM peptidoglycan-binding domain-containing protein [Bacteroidales bacterium]|nr:LysM peptidoglycan-binding domain-containing protein [Bacteroidales bacterium]